MEGVLVVYNDIIRAILSSTTLTRRFLPCTGNDSRQQFLVHLQYYGFCEKKHHVVRRYHGILPGLTVHYQYLGFRGPAKQRREAVFHFERGINNPGATFHDE